MGRFPISVIYFMLGLVSGKPVSSSAVSERAKSPVGGIIEPLHADNPTHQLLMDYAIQMAKNDSNLNLPIAGTMSARGTRWTRMWQGAYQEDWLFDGESEVIRSREHAYNPLENAGFAGYGTARNRTYSIWQVKMDPYFYSGYLDAEETLLQWGGAWQQLGRVSHLLQDMTSPLHVLSREHLLGCMYEIDWGAESNSELLTGILNNAAGALYSDGPLPVEATSGLDPFSIERLQYWFDSNAFDESGPIGCPYKDGNDVRGYLEVLAWITYFRVTVWGEVSFGSGSSGNATAPNTTETDFSDGHVGLQTNALHTMFDGNVRFRVYFFDSYYEITDRNGTSFLWMHESVPDDWAACGASWADGRQDTSKIEGASGYDHADDEGVRVTGRFWFDTRQINRMGAPLLYPHKRPDGTSTLLDLYNYYGQELFPLTVRYNAGLLGLANRRVTVRTSTSNVNDLTWSRKDNFGNGPTFPASTSGQEFYFVAKSPVTLTAPATDRSGNDFKCWLRNGFFHLPDQTIAVNNPPDTVIGKEGDILIRA